MRINPGNPALTGPFSALSPVSQPVAPTPVAAYAQDPAMAPPQALPAAQAAGGGGIGSILGGLFGGGQGAAPAGAPAAQPRGGLLGMGGTLGGILDFSDPQKLIAMQLIANGSKAPGQMFDGVPELASYGAKIQQNKQAKAEEQAQKNQTIEWIKAHRPDRPDLIDMAERGMVGPAFEEAIRKADAPKRQWVTLPDGTAGWANETTGELEAVGNFAKPAEPSDYQKREEELIRRGIDPASPEGQGYVLTGKYAGPGGDAEGGFKQELEASKAYRTEDDVKVYRDIRNAYQRVRASATLGNAQGDIGLVYGFMKMLDPTSVVREGEFATAQNSGGVDDTVRNTYNKILSGERLSPEQRTQFAGAAEQYYNEAADNLSSTNQRYEPMLDEYGVPKERVLEQPMKFEPLTIGQEKTVDMNGTSVTIKKTGE